MCTAFALAVVIAACGGSGGTPNSPTPGGGGDPNTAATIEIAGDRGNRSFTPNPGSSGLNQMVTWRNTDSVTHRIVLNDGTGDTGDIRPGASSTVMRIPSTGTNYHCSLHPGMIGSIMATGGDPPPPCSGVYC